MTTNVDDKQRDDALRAFVAGYTARVRDGFSVGRQAEQEFARWWNDPYVAAGRIARANGER